MSDEEKVKYQELADGMKIAIDIVENRINFAKTADFSPAYIGGLCDVLIFLEASYHRLLDGKCPNSRSYFNE
jgi:hypothetical protein